MSEPELHVRDLTPPLLVTACETGRHIAHPGDTCEETDELRAVFQAYLERSLTQAYAEAAAETDRLVDQWLLTGESTGAPLGFLALEDVPEPTPAERAFAILEPHLTDIPLYRPRGRTLRWPA
jgi:hypothetical protein